MSNIPFLTGDVSSIIGAVKANEVNGFGTDLLRTGLLGTNDLSSVLLPRDLWWGVAGGVFLGIRELVPLFPLFALLGDVAFWVDSSTPESASVSVKIVKKNSGYSTNYK